MDHYFAISADVCRGAQAEFSIADSRITTIPNGVNVSVFKPLDWSTSEKLVFLNKILVRDPQGWDESGWPGSVSYSRREIERFKEASGGLKPLVIFVGRFLDFKRVPLLIQAVAEANRRSGSPNDPPFNLLVWGGMPGEWEGRHPYQMVRELNLPNVFFCGWLPHDLLSQGLNLADLLVVPSYHEPFGQVLLEAMAVRVPVLATRSGGPLDFVVDSGSEANGWFCDVDDVASLAETMIAALADQTELRQRGQKALDLVRARYDWNRIAQRYLEVYETLAGEP
ncbi:MAG: glycosyltransferase family 4 protein, partial [Gemmatimonadales bacterium]